MRIPDQPPGLAFWGAAPPHALRRDAAANDAITGPAATAQAMAAVHDARRCLSQDHPGLARAVGVAQAVTQALGGADSGFAAHTVRVAPSGRASGLAQLFGGERACL